MSNQAIKYYKKGADLGDENSMLYLSSMYQYGKGTEKKHAKSY